MLKFVGVGALITGIALIVGIVTGDWNLFLKIIALAAGIPLLLSGLLTGAYVNGDRNRANFHTEAKRDREFKGRWVKRLVSLSAPNAVLLIVLIVEYLLTS
ncbi:DUF5316 family protein [Halobacillus seohaensis]|uniref:DUF5316 family protein n=1 Tax=Halobacillus seohaensis TaxID=447421 RepID=A0ABW2EJ58_9BACI